MAAANQNAPAQQSATPMQSGSDLLRGLLEEQERRANEIGATDDERELTKKLLRAAGLKHILNSTNWTSSNQHFIGEPKCWFFLVLREQANAVLAINSFMFTFQQRHLVSQLQSMVGSLAALAALVAVARISVYEAWTAVEPLTRVCSEQLQYLRSKKIAETQNLNARETQELCAEARGGEDMEAKLEAIAKKIRAKRPRHQEEWHRGAKDDDRQEPRRRR